MDRRLSIVSDWDKLFPVQAFFNAISESRFVFTIRNLTQGVGAAFNVAACTFPGDLDPCDAPFEGVKFSLNNEEVIVDQTTFERFLTLACQSYVQQHPDQRAEIESLLKK